MVHTRDNIMGQLQKELGGYRYAMCSNLECEAVNLVTTYRIIYHDKARGVRVLK
jgi:hypothetical protein